MITFSVNEKRFNEKDLKIIAHLLKELKSSGGNEYKRLGISEMISEYLDKGVIPKKKQNYHAHGIRVEQEEILDIWRKEVHGKKVFHVALDSEPNTDFDSESVSTEHDRVSDYRDLSVEDEAAAIPDREIHFKVFGIVEAHLNKMGVSLFKVIDPLVDATLVPTKTVVRNPRVEKKFESCRKSADQFVIKYDSCLADINVDPDGTTLTDDVILYLEQHSLIELVRVVFKDKLLWQRIQLSLKQQAQ